MPHTWRLAPAAAAHQRGAPLCLLQELVVRVDLPGVTCAADIDADISSTQLELLVPGKYRLLLQLPHAVDDSSSRARFHKDSQQLQLTLAVVPPEAPQPLLKAISTRPVAAAECSAAAGEVRGGPSSSDAGDASSGEADSSRAPRAEDNAAQQEEAASGIAAAPAAASGPCSAAAGAGPELAAAASSSSSSSGPQLTENQRNWLALHSQGGSLQDGRPDAYKCSWRCVEPTARNAATCACLESCPCKAAAPHTPPAAAATSCPHPLRAGSGGAASGKAQGGAQEAAEVAAGEGQEAAAAAAGGSEGRSAASGAATAASAQAVLKPRLRSQLAQQLL
jgi:hypothetical protein